MVFKGGYGRFTARIQVRSGGLRLLPSIAWAVISTVMTISIYYVLLTLAKNNNDSLPLCFSTSSFGLLYLYTMVNVLVLFILLISKINFIRFPEITSNRWNLMASMGIATTRLVGRKVCSSIFAIIRQYLFGYLLVIACGFAFNLPFSINYLLSLFCIGAILLVQMCIIAMSLTIFTKRISGARFLVFLSFIFVEAMMVYFKIYHQDLFQIEILINLFRLNDLSFLTFNAMLFILCYSVILLKAANRTRYQLLQPLDVFDIRPLISGNETELYLSEGSRHTTIFDTDNLQEQSDYRISSERPNTPVRDEGVEGYPFKLLLFLSILLCAVSLVLLVVSLLLPNVLFERVFGENLCSILDSTDSQILLSEIAAVFTVFIILFSILNGNQRRKRLAE
ncbi:MAG: hypothetical protein FWG21_05295 [Oscillospiraceae bacterium]|nr:hypothetical protein [Oscillospiraceae bacterium]